MRKNPTFPGNALLSTRRSTKMLLHEAMAEVLFRPLTRSRRLLRNAASTPKRTDRPCSGIRFASAP